MSLSPSALPCYLRGSAPCFASTRRVASLGSNEGHTLESRVMGAGHVLSTAGLPVERCN